MLLNRLAEELGDLAIVEQRPQQDGRNMVMMLAPSRAASEDATDAEAAAAAEEEAAKAKPRKAPHQKAPGSAEPVEINPELI